MISIIPPVHNQNRFYAFAFILFVASKQYFTFCFKRFT